MSWDRAEREEGWRFDGLSSGHLAADFIADGALLPNDVAWFVGAWYTAVQAGGR